MKLVLILGTMVLLIMIISMAIAYYFFDMDILFRTPMSLAKSMHYKTYGHMDIDWEFTPLYKGQRPKPESYGIRVKAAIQDEPLGIFRITSSRTYWFKRKIFLWREDSLRNLGEMAEELSDLQTQIDTLESMKKRLNR